MTRIEFLLTIDLLCQLHYASVTSGRRTEARNKTVGGNPHSMHCSGMAADLVPDDWARAKLLARDANRLGLQAVIESDHVHIENDK